MKINFTKELQGDTDLSHVVLRGLAYAITDGLSRKLANEGKTDEGVVLDIVLTANGHELNLQEVIDSWNKYINRDVTSAAERIVKDKFWHVREMLDDLERRMKPEIDSRLEEWEKDNT